jgi:hypothetical protein
MNTANAKGGRGQVHIAYILRPNSHEHKRCAWLQIRIRQARNGTGSETPEAEKKFLLAYCEGINYKHVGLWRYKIK